VKRIHRTALIAALVLAALPLFAQSPSGQKMNAAAPSPATASAIPPDQQATKEQVEKLFDVLRLRKQMQQMLSMMPALIRQSFQAQIKNISEKLPPGQQPTQEYQANIEKIMNKYMQQAVDLYPVDAMMADAVPVYQRHLSRTDADTVIAFYSSPAGQRMLDEQPAMMREYMAVVMSNMQERTKRLTDEMIDEIQKTVKPDPGAPAPASK
jgi:uncharacterized protein